MQKMDGVFFRDKTVKMLHEGGQQMFQILLHRCHLFLNEK